MVTAEEFFKQSVMKSYDHPFNNVKLKISINTKVPFVKITACRKHFFPRDIFIDKLSLINYIRGILNKYQIKNQYGTKGFINTKIDFNTLYIYDVDDIDKLSYLFRISK